MKRSETISSVRKQRNKQRGNRDPIKNGQRPEEVFFQKGGLRKGSTTSARMEMQNRFHLAPGVPGWNKERTRVKCPKDVENSKPEDTAGGM